MQYPGFRPEQVRPTEGYIVDEFPERILRKFVAFVKNLRLAPSRCTNGPHIKRHAFHGAYISHSTDLHRAVVHHLVEFVILEAPIV